MKEPAESSMKRHECIEGAMTKPICKHWYVCFFHFDRSHLAAQGDPGQGRAAIASRERPPHGFSPGSIGNRVARREAQNTKPDIGGHD